MPGGKVNIEKEVNNKLGRVVSEGYRLSLVTLSPMTFSSGGHVGSFFSTKPMTTELSRIEISSEGFPPTKSHYHFI